MSKPNLKHFLAFIMFFLSVRVVLLSSDFLTATILCVFGVSILTNEQ